MAGFYNILSEALQPWFGVSYMNTHWKSNLSKALAAFAILATAAPLCASIEFTDQYSTPENPVAGQQISFIFRLRNTGTELIEDAVLTATLPAPSVLSGMGYSSGGMSANYHTTGSMVVYNLTWFPAGTQFLGQVNVAAPPVAGMCSLNLELGQPQEGSFVVSQTSIPVELAQPPGDLPDLAISWSEKPTPRVKCRKTCKLKGTLLVKNNGTEINPTTGTVNFWLSADDVLSIGGDMYLGGQTLKPIKPGKTKRVRLKALPQNATSGMKLFAVIRDPDSHPEDNWAIYGPLP